MNLNKVVTTTLSAIFATQAFSAYNNSWRPVATLSAGPAWSAPGATQTIYLQPELPESFNANTTTEIFADGEIFLGLQHLLTSHLQSQIGLTLAGTTAIPLNGDIWQDADPNFNNLTYDYKISHTHVAAKGKLLTTVYPWVQPYVSASLGIGFNHAYNYTSASKLFEVLPEPGFAAHTTTAFTYTLGLGLQRELSRHWFIGIGYEFANWGKTTLSAATGQLSNNGLNLNHVYTHELQFSLSFIV